MLSTDEILDVQPREIVESTYRALYARGADPFEAEMAGRAILIAERTGEDGLHLLQEWAGADWSDHGRPAPRAAIQDAELARCGLPTHGDTAVPASMRVATRELLDGTAGDFDRTALRMSRERWEGFHTLANAYLTTVGAS